MANICATSLESNFLLAFRSQNSTSLKPNKVINCLTDFYKKNCGNVHRSVHTLSIKATDAYEMSRTKIQKLLNAERKDEIIFTSGATDSLNLIANTWGEENIDEGHEILLTVLEHHSNIIPWQMLCKRKNARIRFLNLTNREDGFDINYMEKIFAGGHVKLLSISHASNVLGSIHDIKNITAIAHKYGSKVIIDACQSVPHMKVDVKDINCDFLVASGHKMCGPTGIGILYAKAFILENMPPYRGGGAMIVDVYKNSSTYAMAPYRWEAGTPPIAGAIALGEAAEFLYQDVGFTLIEKYERYLSQYLYEKLSEMENIRIYGPNIIQDKSGRRNALVALNHDRVISYDLAIFLNYAGIAVRPGHHCAQILHRDVLLVSSSLRASLYFYNTVEEICIFSEKLKSIIKSLESI